MDFLLLLVFVEGIFFFSGGEIVLWVEVDLFEWYVLCGFGELCFYFLWIFQFVVFGGDQFEDYLLMVGMNKVQWCEIFGVVVVVFQEESIDIDVVKQYFGYWFVIVF